MSGLELRYPQVGDQAYHKSGLDPREVIAVRTSPEGKTQVRLDIFGETDWIDAVNYTFEDLRA